MNYAKRKGVRIINLYDEKAEPTYGMTKQKRKLYYENFENRFKKFLKNN